MWAPSPERSFMKAVVYSEAGAPEVLRLVDRPEPVPGPGEVLVRIAVSGVNPTDWKSRLGGPGTSGGAAGEKGPQPDGARPRAAACPGVGPAACGAPGLGWGAT